jgi:hypothetical protein
MIQQTFKSQTNTIVGAQSTIKRQDRHLKEYRTQSICWFVFNKRSDEVKTYDPTSDENDTLFFPDNRDHLFDLLKWYVNPELGIHNSLNFIKAYMFLLLILAYLGISLECVTRFHHVVQLTICLVWRRSLNACGRCSSGSEPRSTIHLVFTQ